MLIKVPKVRWARDQGVQELIEHLEQPERKNKWDHLTNKEIQTVLREVERCRNDFSYAARNYFWIKNEHDRRKELFKLWPSQELILDKIEELRRNGVAQRIQIIKARQLGCSSVIEGRIAWRAMFFSNVNAIIVSEDELKATRLFEKPSLILDNLPWWLRPMVGAREIKGYLLFDNPDHEKKEINPGLNSSITAKGANKITSVGRGEGVNALHISEYALYPEDKARQIIQEEFDSALSESVETFAILESTARGAGTYAHELWVRNVQMAEKAEWYPLFLPWFFEKRHVRAPEGGWRPQQDEIDMAERAYKDWVQCDNKDCLQFHQRFTWQGVDIDGTTCHTCEFGIVRPYQLADAQLCWMERKRLNRQGDEKDLSKLRQERASTAEEAFVLSGQKVIDEAAMAWAFKNIMRAPLARGYLDQFGNFHGVDSRSETGHCLTDSCGLDHHGDADHLLVYEWPKPGASYVIGGDPSGGLGQDYSAASVLRVGRMGSQDIQVAIFADNRTAPEDFAAVLNQLGRFYNEALIAVERDKIDTALSWLRIQLQYPNLYIDRNLGNQYTDTTRYGWTTNAKTRVTLWSTTRKWLKERLLVLLDPITAEELKNFRIEEEKTKKTKKTIFHDDRIIATMIAVAVAHQMDIDEAGEYAPTKSQLTIENAPYIFACSGCKEQWPAQDCLDYRKCPFCQTMLISSRKNDRVVLSDNLSEFLPTFEADAFPEFDCM